jgi:polysaccharide deacetylase 2 family uncharacterized protein YibQ
VVIDDLGLDRARTAELIRLLGPLTLSFMTYASDLAQQTEIAHRAGHELFLHVPMEAVDRHEDTGPHAARDVFLDDDQTPAVITKELARTEQVARQHGSAIVIGHPHDATIAALKTWLTQVESKGLALVPVTAVVRRRTAEEAQP